MMIVPAQPPVDLAQVRQFAHRENCEYNDDGFSCTVPAGHYFMMGDNRDQSSDSRYWGFVPDDHIKGTRIPRVDELRRLQAHRQRHRVEAIQGRQFMRKQRGVSLMGPDRLAGGARASSA